MSRFNAFALKPSAAELRAQLEALRDMQRRADDRYDSARTEGERVANIEISRYAMRQIESVLGELNGW
jgi:hypothetical protein